MASKRLTDIATRHQVYLERLKSGQVKKFDPVLKRLESAIVEVVAAIDAAKMSDMKKIQLREVLAELRTAQTQIMVESVADMMLELEKISGYEAEFEAKTFEQLTKDVSVAYIPAKKAYAEALARPMSVNGQLLEPFINDWSAKEVGNVSNLIRKGYADGWTNQQMIQAVRGTKKLQYADGIIASIGRNADAVVRTAVQHVASTSRMATWSANSDIVEGYEYVATLDSKTTQTCRSLDGKVFKLGEGPVPPVHIRCRSTTVAKVSSKFDFLDEGATRSSKDGYVSADLSYYDWLKTQPKNFQDTALGPTRAKLFRDGGLSADKFAKLNLGRNFQPLTLDEMRKLEPHAFEQAGI